MSSSTHFDFLRSFAQGVCSLPAYAKNACKQSRVACIVSGTVGMGACLAVGYALPPSRATALARQIRDCAIANGALTAVGGGVIGAMITFAVVGTGCMLYCRKVQKAAQQELADPKKQQQPEHVEPNKPDIEQLSRAHKETQAQHEAAQQELASLKQEHQALLEHVAKLNPEKAFEELRKAHKLELNKQLEAIQKMTEANTAQLAAIQKLEKGITDAQAHHATAQKELALLQGQHQSLSDHVKTLKTAEEVEQLMQAHQKELGKQLETSKLAEDNAVRPAQELEKQKELFTQLEKAHTVLRDQVLVAKQQHEADQQQHEADQQTLATFKHGSYCKETDCTTFITFCDKHLLSGLQTQIQTCTQELQTIRTAIQEAQPAHQRTAEELQAIQTKLQAANEELQRRTKELETIQKSYCTAQGCWQRPHAVCSIHSHAAVPENERARVSAPDTRATATVPAAAPASPDHVQPALPRFPHVQQLNPISKELLNTARGWNAEREISNRKAWKVDLDLPRGTCKITRQGANDIDRQPVIIGDTLYPTTRTDGKKERSLTVEETKIRRLELLNAIRAMFEGMIDNDRAAEVLALLCSQSVLGPLETTVNKTYCQDGGGHSISTPGPHPKHPVVRAVKLVSNVLVFTAKMHYETQPMPKKDKKFKSVHIKTHVKILIPKEVIASKSMEQLSQEDCFIDHGIKQITT